jgi:putative sterol carrier protein
LPNLAGKEEIMAESPREVFERYTSSPDPELEGLDGHTVRFDIEGHGSWLLTVKGLTVEASESAASADTVVTCSEADFHALRNGELNMVTAWMRGQIQLEGDPLLAQKVHSVLRARAYQRAGG